MVLAGCLERTSAPRASVNEPSACRKNTDKFPQRPVDLRRCATAARPDSSRMGAHLLVACYDANTVVELDDAALPYRALNADSSAATSGPNFGGLASKDGVIP